MIALPEVIILETAAVSAAQGRLWPTEEKLLAQSRSPRRQEFTAGRTLARQALARAGQPDQALLADAQRCPIWPPGISGSISHTHTWCAVAIAPTSAVTSLGIDIEEAGRVKPDLWRMLFTEGEHADLKALAEEPRQAWADCLFSIKEAFYKYQFPLTQKMVHFQDVEIERSSEEGTAIIRILKSILAPLETDVCLKAYYHLEKENNLVWTAVYGEPIADPSMGQVIEREQDN